MNRSRISVQSRKTVASSSSDPTVPPMRKEECSYQHPSPTPNLLAPVPMQPKRKRPPVREEECSFCRGNDNGNKHGQPELMVTCAICGRSGKLSAISIPDPPQLSLSGHPTCMDLAPVADIMRSYPWKCIECKTCEICREKGNDVSIDPSFLASCLH